MYCAPRALLGVHTVQEAKEGGARVISMAITGIISIDEFMFDNLRYLTFYLRYLYQTCVLYFSVINKIM